MHNGYTPSGGNIRLSVPYDYPHIPSQPGNAIHHLKFADAPELPFKQAGKLGLGQSHKFRSLRLSQTTGVQNVLYG
jgi:hypothetical protein